MRDDGIKADEERIQEPGQEEEFGVGGVYEKLAGWSALFHQLCHCPSSEPLLQRRQRCCQGAEAAKSLTTTHRFSAAGRGDRGNAALRPLLSHAVVWTVVG